jgi:hypothetical protein
MIASPHCDSNQQHQRIIMKASRLIVAGAAIALLPLSAALAQSAPDQTAPPQSEPPQQAGTTFESLDADSDGRISKTEAQANANVSAQFARYDVNGDGFIERSEVGQANGGTPQTPKE